MLFSAVHDGIDSRPTTHTRLSAIQRFNGRYPSQAADQSLRNFNHSNRVLFRTALQPAITFVAIEQTPLSADNPCMLNVTEMQRYGRGQVFDVGFDARSWPYFLLRFELCRFCLTPCTAFHRANPGSKSATTGRWKLPASTGVDYQNRTVRMANRMPLVSKIGSL